ncbi:unnamed protein product [Brassica napus]|uniref:RING-type E3 ubiquitin transferase n=1 Tax=Brassica napus TaxID=3708 RepID=A0A816I1X3_BRANA|nr:unnamed protein product [Brassica napus]
MDEKLVKRRIVLVPVPAQGHVTPIMQLGKALHSKGFSITVIQTQYNRVSSSQDFSDFQFLTIPGTLTDSDLNNLGALRFLIKLNQICEASFKHCFGQLLQEQVSRDDIACVIYDEYMYFSAAAFKEFQLPSVIFSTTNATAFVCRSALSKFNADKFLIDMKDPEVQNSLFPGLDPLRYKDLPTSAFGTLDDSINLYSEAVNTRTASTVIINSASCLESSSLSRLQRELQVPVYPIGPLHIAASAPSSLLVEDRSCIEWLDKQKPSSVVYISLGSLGLMENKDMLEMARGLSNSNQPFLWVIRPGSVPGSEWTESLPEEFSKLVSERGYIVKWAPQMEVLRHRAVGGFWSHCGWNSTLESIGEGVPMICRPITGDQKVNARRAGERNCGERVVKRLIVDEEGEDMRKRAMDLKEKLEASVRSGVLDALNPVLTIDGKIKLVSPKLQLNLSFSDKAVSTLVLLARFTGGNDVVPWLSQKKRRSNGFHKGPPQTANTAFPLSAFGQKTQNSPTLYVTTVNTSAISYPVKHSPRVYSHCMRFVSVWSESEQGATTVSVSCPHCDGGFIEEITDPSSAAAAELTPPPSTEVRSIINNRRSIIRRRRSTPHPSFNPVIVLQGGDGERDDGEEEEARDRRRAYEFYYDDGSGLGLRPLPDSVSEILMGSGFERLLEQLSQIDAAAGIGLGRSGNPPASKSAIESLPRVEISDCHVGAEANCAVCTEVFEAESEAREMPCKHIFHEDCIVPWLSIRNSCPVCRFELPSESNGEEGDNNPVGMTIWRLPGGGFAVGRFNAAMREGERVLPVVLTEMDGGGIGGNSDGPRRISWVRANGTFESGSNNGGGGGSGSGGRLRRMVRGMVSLMRRVRPNRAVSSSSNQLGVDSEVETRVMDRSNSVLRRYFGRSRSNRDSSVLH